MTDQLIAPVIPSAAGRVRSGPGGRRPFPAAGRPSHHPVEYGLRDEPDRRFGPADEPGRQPRPELAAR